MTRTVLITNGNVLSLISLGPFLLRFHEQIAGVVITTRLPSQKSNVTGVLSMLRQSGWRYTRFKLMTNVFLPLRLRREGLPAGVQEFLQRLGSRAEILAVPKVNTPEVLARVRQMKPDLLLSFSATTRFKDELIAIPTRAAINAHYALLPAYAGLSPYFWYLRNREPESGVTLHRIVPQLDAGPIIEQQRFALDGLRTVAAVLRRQMACVSPMLMRFYEGRTTERDATPQDLSKRSYYGHPRRADMRALAAHGHRCYDRTDLEEMRRSVRELVG
jgi:methionyl-tRNA formyltransferase